MNEQPVAPKSNNKKVLLFGCLGLLLLAVPCGFGGCLMMSGGVAAVTALSAPADQTKGFFRDLRAHDYQTAYGRMNTQYTSTHTVAAFQSSVESIPALTQQTDDTINNRNVSNGVATMSGTLSTMTGAVPVEARLTESDGVWHIDMLLVDGVPFQ